MEFKLSPNPSANLLAIVAILGILAALSLILFASNREIAQYGPAEITASREGELYFDAVDQIYKSDIDGRLLQSKSLEELGIDGPIRQFSMLEDDLLLLDKESNEIRRCDTRAWRCSPLIENTNEPTGKILSFTLAPDLDRIYLAAERQHSITAYDLDGQKLYTLEVPEGLKYVNDLQWLGGNRLLLTDTNHHRVLELEDIGNGEVTLIQQIDAHNEIGRKGRNWPTEAKKDSDGGTWVVNSNGLLHKGDLIYYDTNGTASKRIELETESEISAITLYPGGVVVSDSKAPALIFVARSDFAVTRLQDGSLQELYAQISQQRSYWQIIHYSGFGLLVIFITLGLLAGYMDWRTREQMEESSDTEQLRFDNGELIIPQEVKASVSPDNKGVYWLSLKSEGLRKTYLLTFLITGMLIWTLYQVFQDATDNIMESPLLFAAAMLVFLYALLVWLLHFALPKISIGTDGKRLFLIDLFGRTASAPPDGCIKTNGRLLIGKIAIPIKQQKLIQFDDELFRVLIKPLLTQVPKTNEFALLLHNLNKGDPATYLGLLAILLLLIKEIWF